MGYVLLCGNSAATLGVCNLILFTVSSQLVSEFSHVKSLWLVYVHAVQYTFSFWIDRHEFKRHCEVKYPYRIRDVGFFAGGLELFVTHYFLEE